MTKPLLVYFISESTAITAQTLGNSLLSQFENLFRNAGDVVNGFPAALPLDQIEGREQYDPAMLEENLMFGNPETVIAKLKRYQALGVNEFIYYASMGLDHDAQKRSLRMFCNEVMPEFR